MDFPRELPDVIQKSQELIHPIDDYLMKINFLHVQKQFDDALVLCDQGLNSEMIQEDLHHRIRLLDQKIITLNNSQQTLEPAYAKALAQRTYLTTKGDVTNEQSFTDVYTILTVGGNIRQLQGDALDKKIRQLEAALQAVDELDAGSFQENNERFRPSKNQLIAALMDGYIRKEDYQGMFSLVNKRLPKWSTIDSRVMQRVVVGILKLQSEDSTGKEFLKLFSVTQSFQGL